MAHAQWAVDVRSLDTGEVLYRLNAGRLMMPASNMKILTLAAAAETLGWDARFTTTLEAYATVEAGVLTGDLFVRGGGDPTINTRDGRAAAVFDEWATALMHAGITEIHGRIIGDDQAFDDEGLGDGWAWDYLQFGYAAPVGALQYNEDVAQLLVTPGTIAGEPTIVQLSPGAGLSTLNRSRTAAPDAADTGISFRRHLQEPVLEISGSTPLGGRPFSGGVAVVNPTLFFARALKDALVARGIAVVGEAADLDDVAASIMPENDGQRRVLATTQSPPLRAIASVLMKVSQNLYAETLLKATGSAASGQPSPDLAGASALGTTEAGRAAARSVFASWGIDPSTYVMTDGSGLSRYNYVTASTVTAILERMYKDPKHRDAFMATLPIAGKDGTIGTRMRRTRAEGNAVAKTGSIANVRSLSGYVRSRDGEMLVFSILANDFVIPAATVNWIADLGVEILSNFTRTR
jgi:D-alanyl-D-alanine carboxypeptidase/D-alanyl-D-alanine-endopeptidase (penicillin-binding protein 4)